MNSNVGVDGVEKFFFSAESCVVNGFHCELMRYLETLSTKDGSSISSGTKKKSTNSDKEMEVWINFLIW